MVVDGSGSLHGEVRGQVAVCAGEALVVVVRGVVLPGEAQLRGRRGHVRDQT